MLANPYEYISEIYSHLMKSISYQNWAKYISEIVLSINKNEPKILEIASGTGETSGYLKKEFPDLIVSDISFSMLRKNNPDLRRVCCDMKALPFKSEFDFIFSSFDSVNYLFHKKEILRFLNESASILAADGILTFDVSLFKNSVKHSKILNRKGTHKGIKYSQESKFDKNTGIHTNKFILILENGEIVEEIHKQKIYPFYDYFELIAKTRFYVSACYRAFTFKDANPDVERAQFVLKKRK